MANTKFRKILAIFIADKMSFFNLMISDCFTSCLVQHWGLTRPDHLHLRNHWDDPLWACQTPRFSSINAYLTCYFTNISF